MYGYCHSVIIHPESVPVKTRENKRKGNGYEKLDRYRHTQEAEKTITVWDQPNWTAVVLFIDFLIHPCFLDTPVLASWRHTLPVLVCRSADRRLCYLISAVSRSRCQIVLAPYAWLSSTSWSRPSLTAVGFWFLFVSPVCLIQLAFIPGFPRVSGPTLAPDLDPGSSALPVQSALYLQPPHEICSRLSASAWASASWSCWSRLEDLIFMNKNRRIASFCFLWETQTHHVTWGSSLW